MLFEIHKSQRRNGNLRWFLFVEEKFDFVFPLENENYEYGHYYGVNNYNWKKPYISPFTKILIWLNLALELLIHIRVKV